MQYFSQEKSNLLQDLNCNLIVLASIEMINILSNTVKNKWNIIKKIPRPEMCEPFVPTVMWEIQTNRKTFIEIPILIIGEFFFKNVLFLA